MSMHRIGTLAIVILGGFLMVSPIRIVRASAKPPATHHNQAPASPTGVATIDQTGVTCTGVSYTIAGSCSDVLRLTLGCYPPLVRVGSQTDCYARVTDANGNSSKADVSWDFGDGATLASQNPASHVFTAAGNYTVSASIQNFGQTVFQVTPITVAAAPASPPLPTAGRSSRVIAPSPGAMCGFQDTSPNCDPAVRTMLRSHHCPLDLYEVQVRPDADPLDPFSISARPDPSFCTARQCPDGGWTIQWCDAEVFSKVNVRLKIIDSNGQDVASAPLAGKTFTLTSRPSGSTEFATTDVGGFLSFERAHYGDLTLAQSNAAGIASNSMTLNGTPISAGESFPAEAGKTYEVTVTNVAGPTP